jgi:FtsH-binding integral membrane protein
MTAQPSVSPELTGARGGVFAAAKVLTALFVLGALVSFFLAGLGTFGLSGPVDDAAASSSLNPHRMLGEILFALALLILVLVAIARPGGRALKLAAALFVLMLVQYGLGQAGAGVHVLGGLHALNALFVTGAAFGLASATGALRKPH